MNNQLDIQHQAPVVINSVKEANNAFSMANLIFHPYAMEKINEFAEEMAKSKSLPNAFRGDKAACKTLIMKAGSLNMDPIAIGAHAFIQPNGVIGFESKVYQSMAKASEGIEFEDEYFGNWNQVIGKFHVATGANGGKYNVADYTRNDEDGLAIKLTGTWPCGKKKSLTVYMAECHPRFSANWANDPRMQTYYSVMKKFLRKYAPGVIMGIFDHDDGSRNEERAEIVINANENNHNPAAASRPSNDGPSNLDDILDGEIIVQPELTPEKTKVAAPENLDDIFNGSAFQTLYDLLNDVTTWDEYEVNHRDIAAAHQKKDITGEEFQQLNNKLVDIYSKLDQQ